MFSVKQLLHPASDPSPSRYPAAVQAVREALADCDAVFIGAGAGLSTAAGYTYSGDRFTRYFYDFIREYGFTDAYSGGFYPFETPEEKWAFWSRNVYINRYAPIPKDTYSTLLRLVQDKDYFVISTNVDHCFQRAGFDKKRLFYTQGDYGLWQCSEPCHKSTYDNEETIRQMVLSQGFTIAEDGSLVLPEFTEPKMRVPASLIPHCPVCGKPMSMNLRADDTFVEDEGWHLASERYTEFIRRHQNLKTVYLEIGVGYNTPVIIKYPFWNLTAHNEKATYICLNYDNAGAPREISNQSIVINGDADAWLKAVLG